MNKELSKFVKLINGEKDELVRLCWLRALRQEIDSYLRDRYKILHRPGAFKTSVTDNGHTIGKFNNKDIAKIFVDALKNSFSSEIERGITK